MTACEGMTMKALSGKISDRIRSGELPPDVRVYSHQLTREDEPPKPSSVQHGAGQGLGKGATRARSGD